MNTLEKMGFVSDSYAHTLTARVALLSGLNEKGLAEAQRGRVQAKDDFQRAHAQSVEGEALVKLGRLGEAQPLLMAAHEKLASMNDARHLRTRQSAQRLELCNAATSGRK